MRWFACKQITGRYQVHLHIAMRRWTDVLADCVMLNLAISYRLMKFHACCGFTPVPYFHQVKCTCSNLWHTDTSSVTELDSDTHVFSTHPQVQSGRGKMHVDRAESHLRDTRPEFWWISILLSSLLNNSGLDGRGLSVFWNPDCRCRRLLPKSWRLPISGFLPLDVSSPAMGDILRSGRCRCVRCSELAWRLFLELIIHSFIIVV